MNDATQRAAFEAFLVAWTGRDMEYHLRAGTWGTGVDSFAWAAWQAAQAAERERLRAPLLAHIADLRACIEPLTEAGMLETAQEVGRAADELQALVGATIPQRQE